MATEPWALLALMLVVSAAGAKPDLSGRSTEQTRQRVLFHD